jgi:hypothetical protein
MKNNNLNKIILSPSYVSGFTDAEGCSHVSIVDKAEIRIGKSVRVLFQISLHEKDTALLYLIRDFFSVGEVIDRRDGAFYYKVSQISDLMLILDHFKKFPLLTENV